MDKEISKLGALPADFMYKLTQITRQAGLLALSYFNPSGPLRADVTFKNDKSPVSTGDYAVDRFLKQELLQAFPQAGWLSEETPDDVEARLSTPELFIVDPIDGTRGYIEGDPRWVVSVAYVNHGRPEAAVIYAPALNELYQARRNGGAFCNEWPLHHSSREHWKGSRIFASKKFADALTQRGISIPPPFERIPSLAYSLLEIARGRIDFCLIETKAHDWDIAAAELIISEAGGTVSDAEGRVIVYNQRSTQHRHLLAATPSLHKQFLALPT